MKEQAFTFERFGKDLEEGLSDRSVHPDDAILLLEIRVGCTLGMLLCLDRAHRIAYILGEILGLNSNEAVGILKVRQGTFRKRLERARSLILQFMKARCGLANPENACRCHRRVERALELNRVDRERLLFSGDAQNARVFPKVLDDIRELEEIQRAVFLYRSHPAYAVPDLRHAVGRMFSAKRGLRDYFQ